MMMNGYGHPWFGMAFGMGLWWILILVLVVLAVAFVLRRLPNSGQGGNAPQSARDVLDARYARGEIDREEYAQKKRDLGERGS